MKLHEFTLILSGEQVMTEDLSNRFYEAGCDDGSPYSSQGIAAIRFHRQASTLEEAIRSAVADLNKAGVTAERLVIERDDLAAI
jgi:hypothetical protein